MEEKNERPPSSMTPEVLKLYGMKDSPMVEDEAKSIFNMFSKQDPMFLNREELRSFLFALQEAFGNPRFVPNESVEIALKELQLDTEIPNSISWPDFKSFTVYLVQTPLRSLYNMVNRPLNSKKCEFENAVWVTGLPQAINSTKLFLPEFSKICGQSQQQKPVLAFVSAAANSPGNIAIAFFSNLEYRDAAIAASGCSLFEPPTSITIQPYSLKQQFPARIKKTGPPSTIAVGLASAIQFGMALTSQVASKVTEIDSQYKISEQISTFDQQHGISATAKGLTEKASKNAKQAGESIKAADNQYGVSASISGAVKGADEKLQITDNITQMKKGMLDNENVRKHVGTVSGLFNNLSSRVLDIYEETSQLLTDEGKDGANAEKKEDNASPDNLAAENGENKDKQKVNNEEAGNDKSGEGGKKAETVEYGDQY